MITPRRVVSFAVLTVVGVYFLSTVAALLTEIFEPEIAGERSTGLLLLLTLMSGFVFLTLARRTVGGARPSRSLWVELLYGAAGIWIFWLGATLAVTVVGAILTRPGVIEVTPEFLLGLLGGLLGLLALSVPGLLAWAIARRLEAKPGAD